MTDSDKTARQIYELIKTDNGQISTIRARAKQLAVDCTDPDQRMETTSFTLNGQSGAGTTMSKAALLDLLTRILWQVDNQVALSTRTTRTFFG